MKIRSFLMAASAVALMAGTAHANPLGFRMMDVDGDTSNSQHAPIYMALEAADDVTGVHYLEFEIFDDAGAFFPNDANLDVVVTLPTGVSFAAGGANSTDIYETDMTIATGASLTSGGAPGTQVARYAVSLDDALDNDTIGFRIPVSIDQSICATSDKFSLKNYRIQVDVTTLNFSDPGTPNSGVPIFGQTVVSGTGTADPSVFFQCVDGIVGKTESDEDLRDSFIALSDYNTFGDAFLDDDTDTQQLPLQGTNNFSNGQSPSSRLGWFSADIDTDAVIKLGSSTGTNNLLDWTDIANIAVTVQYEDVTGIIATRLKFDSQPPVAFFNDPSDDAMDFFVTSFGASLLQAGERVRIGAISETLPGGTGPEIEEQSVAVTNTQVNFFSSNMGVNESGDDFCGDGDLDYLQRQGRRFGFFDWVGDRDKATKNVFRLSGLPTLPDGSSPEDVELDIIFNNSRGGPAYDGRFDMTIPAGDISNGVVSINSEDLTDINPGFDQTDVLILVQDTSREIDVDRLQIDRSGSLNDFGDGANFGLNLFGEVTPIGDGDGELGSE